MIHITHFSDPGCPWAWSNGPAFAVLGWRYAAQLEWRHVMIGLGETADHYRRRGTTGESQARNYRSFRPAGCRSGRARPRRDRGRADRRGRCGGGGAAGVRERRVVDSGCARAGRLGGLNV